MVTKPPLPDDYDLPEQVGRWVHAPDSNRNAHVWSAPDVPVSLGVFSFLTEYVAIKVFDDRVDGFENNATVERHPHDERPEAEQVAEMLDHAVTWMNHHDPTEWSHPGVVEAVFDPPVGYVLDRYYLEQRRASIYYRREDTESMVGMGQQALSVDTPTPDTHRYLLVQVWRGSGNATVSLAPWLRAHDHELHEVVTTPEECGLDIALKLTREYVTEATGVTRELLAAGQADLNRWSDD